MQATWQLVQGESGEAGVPSLGALLGNHYLADADRDAPNLMEHIIASTQEPLKPTLIRSAIPLAAMLLLAIGMFVINFNEQGKLTQLEAEYSKLEPVEMRAKELRLQLLRTESKAVEMEKVASQLNRPLGSEALKQLGNCMPSDVWLRRLTLENGKSIQLDGSSFLPAGVYDFVRWLEQAPGFDEVALKATRPTSSEAGPVTGFTLELEVVDLNDQAEITAEKVASNE
ncbi:MAG: PilN domain-containing protein [Lacipirellulaceae bacterium]